LIDIHCHILPGLDDGAHSVEEAVNMAAEIIDAGFDRVIATPHVIEGTDYISPELIREKANELNDIFRDKEISLKILPGAENYIFPDLAKWYREGKIISLADTKKYLLLELPMQAIPTYTEQVFFDLQVSGITPIVAHPERNKEMIREPKRLVEWVENGIQLQINLGSFAGRYGSGSKKLAEMLLSGDMVHFIGSDMHHPSAGDSYLKSISYLMKEGRGHRLAAAASENPANILEGVNWFPEKPGDLVKKKKRLFDWIKM